MYTTKKDKLDVEKNGMLIGLLVPASAIFCYYLYIQPDNFGAFIRHTFNFSIYNRFIGLAIVPNFLIYFYYRWKSKLKLAEGLSMATLLYLFIIVIIKYI